nr:hypothetical protein orf511 [uncultured bacterium]AGD93324.1 hypothetical protein orf511 [uncultured bacterium]
MSHSRDVRVRASEIKFLVGAEAAERIRAWAREHLQADPHGSGVHGDEYQTASLYFDTAGYDVFHRRGSFGRGKYRIRRYGDADAIFLERKMRQAAVLAKRRTRTSVETLPLLAQPSIDPAWAGSWFHRRLSARRLRPVCQVTYQRMARTFVRDGEVMRLTLDADLRARSVREIGFRRGAGVSVLSTLRNTESDAILELKFTGPAPALFRRLVEELELNPQPASKYRLSAAALDPALVIAPPVSDRGGEAVHA